MRHQQIAMIVMVSLLWAAFIGCGGGKQEVKIQTEEPAPVQAEPGAVPAAPPKEVKAEEKATLEPLVLETIYFDYDKYDLTSSALQTLALNARRLKAHSQARILIEGHCDERGTVEYNLALGDKRAKAARDYLVSLGIDPSRISIISYGKERPVDPGHTEEAWARNRRAEFVQR
ncbi:MAG: peptidoglycan-associated lipoprotein Pal [candidate division KSB1 bacterium]|nr:peptidoglycan-associated lipoprotein Pal [candidate division KSB1 bacterium]